MKTAAAFVFGLLATSQAQDSWCGKAYQAGAPEIIPGGWLYPAETSSTPRLDIQISPRHSIYVSSETTGQLIVDAKLSYFQGDPYQGAPPDENPLQVRGDDVTEDKLEVAIQIHCKTVAKGTVTVNTTNNLFDIQIDGLEPRFNGHPVSLIATVPDGTVYKASTELFYLPEKTDGSVVKVDYLYGSLLYRNGFTNGTFSYIFPYGFYGNYDGYFIENENIEEYFDMGFNGVHPVTSFVDSDMTSQINTMDELNLLWQYDMRGSYKNLTSVAWQVPLVKDHPSLLTWYTADEPDGWEDPLNATKLAYDLITEMDKYHPVALVLNCQNYYFPEYSSGAEIIMEDAYPVGINATFSFHGTPCNLTYGDCGCDNCEGSLLDVPDRMDAFHNYRSWLGGGEAARKPIWAVPQAFSDSTYWTRSPTPEEVWTMDILAINHGAKGRFAWIFPSTDVVNRPAIHRAAAEISRVVTDAPVMDFLTQANPVALEDASQTNLIDAAYWKLEERFMVGVANPINTTLPGVEIALPKDGLEVVGVSWGNTSWRVDGDKLVAEGSFPALGTSLILLS